MVFKATLNNISGISWGSVLLKEETGVSGVTDKLYLHNVVSSIPCHKRDSTSQ
jgi:hypothetical protein